MWDMFLNSLKLFLRGKLFREPKAVARQWLIGFGIALVIFLVLAKIGLPVWFAVVVTAFGAGFLQPYLFKDLKYN
ncbi:MAG: hypothetical protein HY028_03345 [Gammaproteobacteria bacterium]|nr:hypothetical protein [Gammaproteobacteria bacterium]